MFDADVDARMKSSESPKICRTPRGGPWKMAEILRDVVFVILWHFFGLRIFFTLNCKLRWFFIVFFEKIQFHQLNLHIIKLIRCSVSSWMMCQPMAIVKSSLSLWFRSFIRLQSPITQGGLRFHNQKVKLPLKVNTHEILQSQEERIVLLKLWGSSHIGVGWCWVQASLTLCWHPGRGATPNV